MNFAGEIQLYEAIKQMRILSAKGKTFSFSHATYNLDRISGSGLRRVRQASLRPAASSDDIIYADLKLFYTDEEIGEPRNCWQHLIKEFNGFKIFL